MMLDLKNPLKQGDKVPVTLEFEKAGKVNVSLEVQGIGAQAAGGRRCGRRHGHEEDARAFRHEDVRRPVHRCPTDRAITPKDGFLHRRGE